VQLILFNNTFRGPVDSPTHGSGARVRPVSRFISSSSRLCTSRLDQGQQTAASDGRWRLRADADPVQNAQNVPRIRSRAIEPKSLAVEVSSVEGLTDLPKLSIPIPDRWPHDRRFDTAVA